MSFVMKLYYCIKVVGFFTGILAISFCYLVSFLFAQDSTNIKEKNITADKMFLNWKVKNDSKFPEDLKVLINVPEKLEFLAQESQVNFDKDISEEEVKIKIDKVIKNFLNKFEKSSPLNYVILDLKRLLKALIMPEIEVFVSSKSQKSKDEEIYNDFMKTLSHYLTPIGTTLKDWALRFFTSETILIGLPMIEKFEVDNKGFSDLTKEQKKQIFTDISLIITRQFMNNLNFVKNKYRFEIPDRISSIIQDKITSFLSKKFEI